MTEPLAPTRRALTIAGSDPSGGAGLQADIAVFTRLGTHPMAIPAALTVQNSIGVKAVKPLDAALMTEQLAALFADMPPHAIKTGMLGDDATVLAVARALPDTELPPLVIDPLLHASSGPQLLTDQGYDTLVTRLFSRALLITPNRDEAERLWGRQVATPEDAARCAADLRDLGPRAVLLTGGHLEEKGTVVDTLADEGGITTWRHPRHPGPTPHGTGCALSAAITAHLALGTPLRESVRRALTYVITAIRTANSMGSGRPYLGDGTQNLLDDSPMEPDEVPHEH
ncbi:MAG: bifunctional hydroxymethylpyrimidine kinase/phosphomethylpyrimidine kinase [Leptospirillia bacterium]